MASCAGCGSSQSASTAKGASNTCTAPIPENVTRPLIDPRNLLTNGSFEELRADSGLPSAWEPAKWGSNDVTFASAGDAHSGERAAQLEITRYEDGDAKWLAAAIDVDAQLYHYREFYKSTVETRVVAMLRAPDGSVHYPTLLTLPPSPQWLELDADVLIPDGTVKMGVQHILSAVGTLAIDDAQLLRDDAIPFARGMVSLTFDDSWQSDMSIAAPLLRKYGVNATHYVITGMLDRPNRLTWDQLEELMEAGDEIAPHTLTHPDLVKVSAEQLETELVQPQRDLVAHCLGSAQNFASPFGSYDVSTLAAIRAHYGSHRTTSGRFNSASGFNRYELKAQGMRPSTSAEDVGKWVEQAMAEKKWLILVYHAIEEPAATEYAVTPDNFEAQLRAIVERKIPIVTIEQGLAEVDSR